MWQREMRKEHVMHLLGKDLSIKMNFFHLLKLKCSDQISDQDENYCDQPPWVGGAKGDTFELISAIFSRCSYVETLISCSALKVKVGND